MDYRTLDPTTEERIDRFATHSDEDVEAALERATAAFRAWREAPFDARARPMLAMADRLEAEAAELGRLMALEMGKPLEEGAAEARKCAWGCRYYAEKAEELLAAERGESDGSAAWVRHDPLGPILAIMPWNFPFWQFFRFAAPALMGGNVALLKHAPNTPRCANEIERLALECGFPSGVVQNLRLTNERAARAIADPRVRGVTLTGSTRAGREVAATAGRHLKPMVLELGGSDPFLVLEDADLDLAVAAGVASRCLNNGQSCIAAKRFVAVGRTFEPFRDRFVAAMAARTMGDPKVPGTLLGPLAREDLRDTLARQVRAAVGAGGRLLTGGEPPARRGFFYPPTVIDGLPPADAAAREELFGPAALLFRCGSEDEAIAIANGTAYGLGASLWTRDLDRARRLVPRIEAGSVFVNGLTKSDPRLPFGGVKDSGFGRELGREGMLQFQNVKTVWVR